MADTAGMQNARARPPKCILTKVTCTENTQHGHGHHPTHFDRPAHLRPTSKLS